MKIVAILFLLIGLASPTWAQVRIESTFLACSGNPKDFEEKFGDAEVVYGPIENHKGTSIIVMKGSVWTGLFLLFDDGRLCLTWVSKEQEVPA